MLPRIIEELSKNMSNWLTFLTTLILGVLTAYFAWRTRQLEARQLKQIHREFDRELDQAAYEVDRGRVAFFHWNNWKSQSDLNAALELYAISGQNLVRPDVQKLQRVLSFYLPGEEKRAGDACIKVHAALTALDHTLRERHHLSQMELDSRLRRVDEFLQVADAELQDVLTSIAAERSRHR